jgi:predicted component of type VI protein secretion system
MAKLLILRGEAQLDARELTEKTVRIGRGTQNDIVLEDPGKGVSRNHAEIRFDGGRYTLVDLQSQNGIWVSGERVPSVVLEPGVSAALGPFRLMVEAPAASPVTAITPVSGIQPVTEMTQLSSRTAAPLELDNLAPPVQKSSPVASPAATPSSPPTPVKVPSGKAPPAKSSTEKTASKPAQKTPVAPASSTNTRTLGAVAAAVILIALSAFIGYKLMHRSPAAVTETANTTPPTSVPVTSSVTTTIPAPPTAEERLNAVEPIVIANVAADCQTALETINAVLTEDPNNERAKGLLAKANACANPKPAGAPNATAEKPAAAISPAQGGLIPNPAETDRAYKVRVAAMRKKYDDAVALLNDKKYQQAMRALDEILPDVPSGYLDLAAHRDEARSAIRAEAKTTLGNAQAAENKGDLDTADTLYRSAHKLDQSLPVDDALQRIADRKLAAGRKKCNDGLTEFSFGNNSGALPLLQDAIRLLPPSDPCYAKAKDALQKVQK